MERTLPHGSTGTCIGGVSSPREVPSRLERWEEVVNYCNQVVHGDQQQEIDPTNTIRIDEGRSSVVGNIDWVDGNGSQD